MAALWPPRAGSQAPRPAVRYVSGCRNHACTPPAAVAGAAAAGGCSRRTDRDGRKRTPAGLACHGRGRCWPNPVRRRQHPARLHRLRYRRHRPHLVVCRTCLVHTSPLPTHWHPEGRNTCLVLILSFRKSNPDSKLVKWTASNCTHSRVIKSRWG